jgi:hypothetical protein
MPSLLSQKAVLASLSSRPIDHIGRRFNEAYLWSARTGYQALRRKWYLPDAPRAKETVWFDQGDRNFRAVPCGPLRFGVQMCSEMMFPEHSRALGLAGAHLVVQLRATGPGKKWNVVRHNGHRPHPGREVEVHVSARPAEEVPPIRRVLIQWTSTTYGSTPPRGDTTTTL